MDLKMAAAKKKKFPENDYIVIEEALSSSKRGRWFLDQYVQRNAKTDAGQMLNSISRLTNLVENQETKLQTVMSPIDIELVKKALGIVEQYLSASGQESLVGLAHDLEQNANMLSTSAENLILAAANMKMGKVDDNTFAQVVAEAERIQDARRFTQSAKSKIATLFQALSLLEGHLREVCGEPSQVNSSDNSQVATPQKCEEAQKKTSLNEVEQPNAVKEISAEEVVKEGQPHKTEDIVPSEFAKKEETTSQADDRNDDDDSDGGTPALNNELNGSDEMSEADLEALFASKEIQSQAQSINDKAQSQLYKERINKQSIEKLAEKMVGHVKTSFQASIADKQMQFFAGNEAVSLKFKTV